MVSERRWHPEEFTYGGSAIGELFLKLLTQGINELSEPELLVRETAQNSWDARKQSSRRSTPMSFRVSDLAVASDVREELKTFFGEASEFGLGRRRPDDPTVLRELWKRLSGEDPSVLYVRDEGTEGLGGPTNARDAVPGGVVDRYVRFLLNIGQANTDESAGGSYGLGRSVFWRMSTCQTVVVYTRYVEGGAYRSRLIGSSIGGSFVRAGVNYTGRHWWSDGENGRPFEGPKAEEWARRLGFEPYEGDTTGTTVMVVAPSTPGGPRDLATALVKSIEYHLWPKYVSLPGRGPEESMTFEVRHDSNTFEPSNVPEIYASPLGNHVRAFELGRVNTAQRGPFRFSTTLDHDFRGVSLRTIGRLSVMKMISGVDEPSVAAASPDLDPDEDSHDLTSVIEARFADLANTVALMRTPELIVGYKRIKNPDQDVVLAGVFKASERANGYLRRCESATHTEWSPTVPRDDADGKIPKRVAKAFEKRFVEQIEAWFPKPVEPTAVPTSKLNVEELSARFGKLVEHLLPGRGSGHRGTDSSEEPTTRPPRRGVSPDVEFVGLEEHHGELVNVWSVDFVHRGAMNLELEILLRVDSNKTERPVVRSGGRPAILSVEGYVGQVVDRIERTNWNFEKRFPVGKIDANTPKVSYEFQPEKDAVSDLMMSLTVKAVYEEGTTPVLAVTVEPIAVKSAETADASEVNT